jgi:hypothetical protein
MKTDRRQIFVDAINAQMALSDQSSIKKLTDLLLRCRDLNEFVGMFDALSGSGSWAEPVIKNALELAGRRQFNSENLLGQSTLSLTTFKEYLRRLFIDIVKIDGSEQELASFVSQARTVMLKFDFVRGLHEILIMPGHPLDQDVIARALKAIYDCHSDSTGGQQLIFDIGNALVMAATLAGETVAAMAEVSLRHGFDPPAFDADALSKRVDALIQAMQEPPNIDDGGEDEEGW